MLKPSKSKILNFFMFYGWSIIIFSLISFAGLTILLSRINRINDNQRFSIFFCAYGLKEERHKDELFEQLKDEGVLQVNYFDYLLNDSKIVTYYSAYGEMSDINIMSERDITDMKEVIANHYLPLSNDLLNELGLDAKYARYAYENTEYGIKIYDKEDASYNDNLSYQEWINFSNDNGDTDSFYILIRKNSVNFGKSTTYGIKGLKYLIDENTK